MDITLPQTATYWSPGGVAATAGAFGDRDFGSPVSISCRWQEGMDFGVDVTGWERSPKAVIYTKTQVQEGGYLYLGSSSETVPETTQGAYLILSVLGSPTIDNDDKLYKAVVG